MKTNCDGGASPAVMNVMTTVVLPALMTLNRQPWSDWPTSCRRGESKLTRHRSAFGQSIDNVCPTDTVIVVPACSCVTSTSAPLLGAITVAHARGPNTLQTRIAWVMRPTSARYPISVQRMLIPLSPVGLEFVVKRRLGAGRGPCSVRPNARYADRLGAM